MLIEKCQQTKQLQKLETETPEEFCHNYWLNGFMGVMMNLVNTLLKLPSLGPGSRVKKRNIAMVGLQIFGYTSQSTLGIQNTKMVSETNFGHSTVVFSPLYVRKGVFFFKIF